MGKRDVKALGMDEMEGEVRWRNVAVRKERKNKLIECGGCGQKWKGAGALTKHMKKCG